MSFLSSKADDPLFYKHLVQKLVSDVCMHCEHVARIPTYHTHVYTHTYTHRTVQGIDDYASMQEAVRRRFTAHTSAGDKESQELPDVLLVSA